jgi:hypothetical protein
VSAGAWLQTTCPSSLYLPCQVTHRAQVPGSKQASPLSCHPQPAEAAQGGQARVQEGVGVAALEATPLSSSGHHACHKGEGGKVGRWEGKQVGGSGDVCGACRVLEGQHAEYRTVCIAPMSQA